LGKGEREMAIKIIIRRRVPKGREGDLLPLLLELRSKATVRPGYISGETLRNVEDPEEYLVVSTWHSVDDWKTWEASNARTEVQKKIDMLLGTKSSYGIYFYG
jgi:heme oxygenase (mycobilin-producing)